MKKNNVSHIITQCRNYFFTYSRYLAPDLSNAALKSTKSYKTASTPLSKNKSFNSSPATQGSAAAITNVSDIYSNDIAHKPSLDETKINEHIAAKIIRK